MNSFLKNYIPPDEELASLIVAQTTHAQPLIVASGDGEDFISALSDAAAEFDDDVDIECGSEFAGTVLKKDAASVVTTIRGLQPRLIGDMHREIRLLLYSKMSLQSYSSRN